MNMGAGGLVRLLEGDSTGIKKLEIAVKKLRGILAELAALAENHVGQTYVDNPTFLLITR